MPKSMLALDSLPATAIRVIHEIAILSQLNKVVNPSTNPFSFADNSNSQKAVSLTSLTQGILTTFLYLSYATLYGGSRKLANKCFFLLVKK